MVNTSIPLYGIMILLSLLLNALIIIFTYNKKIFSKSEIFGAIIYENIGIIVGAKTLAYIENYSLYNGVFDFWKLGLSSYGGIFGGLIFLILFALQFKKKISNMIYTFVLPIPLMYSIGKIGCFLAGCCYGIPYNGFGHIVYKYAVNSEINNISFFPVQLVESIVFFLIFLYACFKHKDYSLKNLGILIILCGFAKFLLDFLRASHMGIILSTAQYISLGFIITGLILIIMKGKKN